MAEVLGTVASGIAVAQLAGVIVSSTQKIYTFWRGMKNAPKDIGKLLHEIEILGGILGEYHSSNDEENGPSATLQKIYQHCEIAIEELDEVLATLDHGFTSRSKAKKTWRIFRVVVKGSTLEDLSKRLDRAKAMLSLASQCQMMWVYSVQMKQLR
ncbi:Ankyrin repeat-containing domain protein [Rutstroemia sp. NJR-2017a BVV2]|nr:Ankyrin repeat-containing domain protein [Rutstroemia sp. NJR-2017a BVV2]PQE09423.1 Ankyrin repeat-containing domain protein [Rutstroemia sp. NJR-2017a BVV2]